MAPAQLPEPPVLPPEHEYCGHDDDCAHVQSEPPRQSLAGKAQRGLSVWVAPVVLGGLGVSACIVVALRDPNVPNSYGFCPFTILTGGLDCPGCGLLRGTHAALNGDIGGAVGHNIFWPVIMVLILASYVRFTSRRFGLSTNRWRVPPWLLIAAGVTLIVFTVLRNVGGPFESLAA